MRSRNQPGYRRLLQPGVVCLNDLVEVLRYLQQQCGHARLESDRHTYVKPEQVDHLRDASPQTLARLTFITAEPSITIDLSRRRGYVTSSDPSPHAYRTGMTAKGLLSVQPTRGIWFVNLIAACLPVSMLSTLLGLVTRLQSDHPAQFSAISRETASSRDVLGSIVFYLLWFFGPSAIVLIFRHSWLDRLKVLPLNRADVGRQRTGMVAAITVTVTGALLAPILALIIHR